MYKRRIEKKKRELDFERSLRENKFYIGSQSALDRSWGHQTLEKAIKHAEELIDDDNDPKFIVQIIRVVRRKKSPVTVQTIK